MKPLDENLGSMIEPSANGARDSIVWFRLIDVVLIDVFTLFLMNESSIQTPDP
jgi:hypothetical protein